MDKESTSCSCGESAAALDTIVLAPSVFVTLVKGTEGADDKPKFKGSANPIAVDRTSAVKAAAPKLFLGVASAGLSRFFTKPKSEFIKGLLSLSCKNCLGS